MSDRLDLTPIADWLDQGATELHGSIVRRLGEEPAALPSRAVLALEAWALPAGIAAAAVCAVAALTLTLLPPRAAPASFPELLADVAAGRQPRAADVYIIVQQSGL